MRKRYVDWLRLERGDTRYHDTDRHPRSAALVGLVVGSDGPDECEPGLLEAINGLADRLSPAAAETLRTLGARLAFGYREDELGADARERLAALRAEIISSDPVFMVSP